MRNVLRWCAVGFVLAVMFQPAVFAQGMSCAVTVPSPATIRVEGLTEMVGDIVITCTGGTAVTTGAFPAFNVSVFMNTAVTSRVLVPSIPALTEAVLLIDDPIGTAQVACTTPVCNNTDNVHQGRQNPNSFFQVDFVNIPINPPGATGQRVLRVKNIRVNATQLPQNGQAVAAVNITGAVPPNISNSTQTVGFVRQSTIAEYRDALDASLAAQPKLVGCTAYNAGLISNPGGGYTTPGGRTMNVRFSELSGFTNSWKKRNVATGLATPTTVQNQEVPATQYGTETGYYNANLPAANGLNRMGLADSGTRFRIQFVGVPANVAIYVTTKEVTPGSTASAHAQLIAPSGTFAPLAADSPADGGLKLLSSTGEAVWEVIETDPANIETISFGVAIAFTGTPQPAPGTINMTAGYGSLSNVGTASATEPIPRMTGAPTSVAVSINACRTTLLFQFLTNSAGFDTGVSISNTSKDTLGTAPQGGRCTATFFPMPATAANIAAFQPLQSPALAGGEQWVFALSGTRAGFQGYMMTTCEFQFAHGYAFISDFGAQKLAQGYQALVIPDRPRVADAMSTASSGAGEQLIH